MKIINVLSWLLRFVNNTRKEKSDRILDAILRVTELENAEVRLYKMHQSCHMHMKLTSLTAGKPVKPSSSNFLTSGCTLCRTNLFKVRSHQEPVIVKAYIGLFVCLVTKAVHIELVSDLSTDTFLAAFHRFVTRRVYPTDVHSDNGMNFIGAKR